MHLIIVAVSVTGALEKHDVIPLVAATPNLKSSIAVVQTSAIVHHQGPQSLADRCRMTTKVDSHIVPLRPALHLHTLIHPGPVRPERVVSKLARLAVHDALIASSRVASLGLHLHLHRLNHLAEAHYPNSKWDYSTPNSALSADGLILLSSIFFLSETQSAQAPSQRCLQCSHCGCGCYLLIWYPARPWPTASDSNGHRLKLRSRRGPSILDICDNNPEFLTFYFTASVTCR